MRTAPPELAPITLRDVERVESFLLQAAEEAERLAPDCLEPLRLAAEAARKTRWADALDRINDANAAFARSGCELLALPGLARARATCEVAAIAARALAEERPRPGGGWDDEKAARRGGRE